MARLPGEIWFMVLEELDAASESSDTSTLQPVLRTCRDFRMHSEKLIWRIVTIQDNIQCIRRCRIIRVSPHLARHVRRLFIDIRNSLFTRNLFLLITQATLQLSFLTSLNLFAPSHQFEWFLPAINPIPFQITLLSTNMMWNKTFIDFIAAQNQITALTTYTFQPSPHPLTFLSDSVPKLQTLACTPNLVAPILHDQLAVNIMHLYAPYPMFLPSWQTCISDFGALPAHALTELTLTTNPLSWPLARLWPPFSSSCKPRGAAHRHSGRLIHLTHRYWLLTYLHLCSILFTLDIQWTFSIRTTQLARKHYPSSGIYEFSLLLTEKILIQRKRSPPRISSLFGGRNVKVCTRSASASRNQSTVGYALANRMERVGGSRRSPRRLGSVE